MNTANHCFLGQSTQSCTTGLGNSQNCHAVNREALIPISNPTGYIGADPYKISFHVGHERFLIPWLLVINRRSEVPLIDVHLRYSGNDMPHHYIEIRQDIKKKFWDPEHWPNYVLVRYTWEEQSEIDVPEGYYVMFGSGLLLSFVLAIYVHKLARFVRETVAAARCNMMLTTRPDPVFCCNMMFVFCHSPISVELRDWRIPIASSPSNSYSARTVPRVSGGAFWLSRNNEAEESGIHIMELKKMTFIPVANDTRLVTVKSLF